MLRAPRFGASELCPELVRLGFAQERGATYESKRISLSHLALKLGSSTTTRKHKGETDGFEQPRSSTDSKSISPIAGSQNSQV